MSLFYEKQQYRIPGPHPVPAIGTNYRPVVFCGYVCMLDAKSKF
jgi:hypothetical protein